MLKDFHFADFLILRYGGHQLFQATVAVVHVVLQAEEVFFFHFAPGDVHAVLRQASQSELTAARRFFLWADWSNSFHFIKKITNSLENEMITDTERQV